MRRDGFRAGPGMLRFLSIFLCCWLAGCTAPPRIPYSAKAALAADVDGFEDIRIYADSNGELPQSRTWLPVLRQKEVNYLVLSGGGARGAFSVGILKAWSDTGQRPEFDMVSGVSTGALIAPYAFLGSSYDQTLVDLYTSGVARDLVDFRFFPKAMLGPSLLDQDPLRKMVERYLSRDTLARIAAEHRKGRRLLVLTSNLDSQRAVIWNMGAIANSGRPDALKLFQDILIASASIPGLYPAVLIKATTGDRVFEEMHSDGGTATQFLTIPEGWLASAQDDPWPKGADLNMYIIINNALMPEFALTTNNTFMVMAKASSLLIKSQTRNALLATYAYARRNGIRFYMASIDVPVSYDMSDPFNTNYMRAIYSLGYAKMAGGNLWKGAPSFRAAPIGAHPDRQK